MGEWEALIQRRKMLSDKISQMSYDVEKIDQHLASLEEISDSELLIGMGLSVQK
jgi:hypothetical protein